ncbi:MAG: hypothetical protein D6701_14845, partial [Gemmatimonadetes bacterium]
MSGEGGAAARVDAAEFARHLRQQAELGAREVVFDGLSAEEVLEAASRLAAGGSPAPTQTPAPRVRAPAPGGPTPG